MGLIQLLLYNKAKWDIYTVCSFKMIFLNEIQYSKILFKKNYLIDFFFLLSKEERNKISNGYVFKSRFHEKRIGQSQKYLCCHVLKMTLSGSWLAQQFVTICIYRISALSNYKSSWFKIIQDWSSSDSLR